MSLGEEIDPPKEIRSILWRFLVRLFYKPNYSLSLTSNLITVGVLALHRADFQRVLARYAIPPATAHFDKRLAGYDYMDENKSVSHAYVGRMIGL